MKERSKALRAFLIALAILIVLTTLNWGIVTGFGNVRITRLTMVGDDGLRYSALLYVPKNATNETPAPAVLIAHGNAGNARNHEAWAVEYTRRGFIVLSIDYAGGGNAEYKEAFGKGMFTQFTNYINALPIVDHDNIVTAGHSMGCSNAYLMARTNGYKTFINADNAMWLTNNFKPENYYECNALILSGKGDRNDTIEKVTKGVMNFLDAAGFDYGETPEADKVYGSFEDKNAVQMSFIDHQIHEGCLCNKDSIEVIMNFTQNSVTAPNAIDGSNQIWMWKDWVGLLCMFAFLACLLLLANLLMYTPAFESIRQPMPKNIGLRGPGLVISIIAALLFPLICMYTGSFGLTKLFGDKNLSLFQLYSANKAFTAVLGINILGLVMLIVYHFTEGKKHKAGLREYGLIGENDKKLNLKLIGKCFILSMIVIAVGFAYISTQNSIFGTDLYSFFFGFKTIEAHNFVRYIPYIIVWIICFIVTTLGMNVERRLPSTGNEKKDFVRAMIFNTVLACIMITFLVLLQLVLQRQSPGYKPMGTWNNDLTKVWGMPVGMAMAGLGCTYLYRKSGTVWLSAFTMGTLCALCCVLYGQFRG